MILMIWIRRLFWIRIQVQSWWFNGALWPLLNLVLPFFYVRTKFTTSRSQWERQVQYVTIRSLHHYSTKLAKVEAEVHGVSTLPRKETFLNRAMKTLPVSHPRSSLTWWLTVILHVWMGTRLLKLPGDADAWVWRPHLEKQGSSL